MNIPTQLQKAEVRIVLVRQGEKAPFEKAWQNTSNYAWNDPKVKEHLALGGNAGILTGNGLIVLDCDCQQAENLARMLPKTLVVGTSTLQENGHDFRKKHFYYECPLQRKQILKDYDKHLGEIQALGQQCLIPPSVHPSGRKYDVLEDRPIAAISEKDLLKAISPFVADTGKIKRTESIGEEIDPICIEIKKKIRVPDLLKKYGFDTTKNPTKCLWHESQGGQCFSFSNDLWNCFHCGRGGSLFHLVMTHESVDFTEAKRKLVIMAKIDVNNIHKLAIPTIPTIPNKKLIKPAGSLHNGFVTEPLGNFEYIFNKDGKRGIIPAIREFEEITTESGGIKKVPTGRWYLEIGDEKHYFNGTPIKTPLFKVPSEESIAAWCRGKYKTKTGAELYNYVVKYLKVLYDVREEKYYHITALGDLQSWVAPIINAVFYLGFGAKFGSGKTSYLEGLANIARHGYVVGNVTEAIARDIHEQQLSVFTDEIDVKAKGGDNPLYQCYRQGYRRGNIYLRHKDKTYEPQAFDPFGFKGFSLHDDVEVAFKQRTIPTPLKVTSDKALPILNLFKEQMGFPLFENLFFFYMENAPLWYSSYSSYSSFSQKTCQYIFEENSDIQAIRNQIYNEITKQFSQSEVNLLKKFIGRNIEITYIALLVAKIFGIDIKESLKSCIESKQLEETVHSDQLMIELLKDRLTQEYNQSQETEEHKLIKGDFRDCFYIPKTDIESSFRDAMREKGQKFRSETFTGWLREIGFVDGDNMKMQKVKWEDDKQKKCLIFDDDILVSLQIKKTKRQKTLDTLGGTHG